MAEDVAVGSREETAVLTLWAVERNGKPTLPHVQPPRSHSAGIAERARRRCARSLGETERSWTPHIDPGCRAARPRRRPMLREYGGIEGVGAATLLAPRRCTWGRLQCLL